MMDIVKDASLQEREILFGLVEVSYPDLSALRAEAFYEKAEEVLRTLREEFAGYDRKAVFGEHPYYRFFKKFKKTYPVMLQFESCLFQDRPFPHGNPVAEVPFLAELKTRMLMGTHDIDRVQGQVRLISGTAKEPFPGLRGEAHTYPNDVVGRDDGGIILSMIAGADERTCAHPESRHVFYPVFGVPGMPEEEIRAAQEVLVEYTRVLCPEAEITCRIL